MFSLTQVTLKVSFLEHNIIHLLDQNLTQGKNQA